MISHPYDCGEASMGRACSMHWEDMCSASKRDRWPKMHHALLRCCVVALLRCCIVALLRGIVWARRFVGRGLSVMLVATGAGEKNSREMEAPYARYGENDVTTPNPAWLIRVYQTSACRERHRGWDAAFPALEACPEGACTRQSTGVGALQTRQALTDELLNSRLA
jgi:hypothetical protein